MNYRKIGKWEIAIGERVAIQSIWNKLGISRLGQTFGIRVDGKEFSFTKRTYDVLVLRDIEDSIIQLSRLRNIKPDVKKWKLFINSLNDTQEIREKLIQYGIRLPGWIK